MTTFPRGWADLGEGFDLPDTVLLLDDVPHDWLLPKCSAVVHHGGAGTTAAGDSTPLSFPSHPTCLPPVPKP
jgi:hypothetical protein